MSRPLMRFGSVTGLAAGDVRIRIGGKGRKNVLSMTASYQRATAGSPATTFQGRLVIIEGQLDPVAVANVQPVPADFPSNTNFSQLGKVLFDATFSDVGPHPFFLPIAQQEGSPQSDEDSTINIILCIGTDGVPNTYIPTLVASGQTVFGGQLAGQQTFAGSQWQ